MTIKFSELIYIWSCYFFSPNREPVHRLIYILSWTTEKHKKNSFQATTFTVVENSRTFQGLAQKFKDFQGKIEFKDFT